MNRLLTLSLAALAISVSPASGETGTAIRHGVMPERHFAIFEKYCLDCHDGLTEKGGMNLEDLSFRIDTIEAAEGWQKVLNTLNSGEMPPEDKDQLTDEEKTEFLSDLSNQLVVARDALADSHGVITMRRLNRREYGNTIESLLGVNIDTLDLPDDTGSGGFDTHGASLFFSGDQFEIYHRLAHRALVFGMLAAPRPEVRKERIEAEDLMLPEVRNLVTRFAQPYLDEHFPGRNVSELSFAELKTALETSPNLRWANYLAYLDHPASGNGAPLYNFFRDFALPKVELPRNGVKHTFRIRARVAVLHDDVPEHRRYIEFGSPNLTGGNGELNTKGFRKVTGTMDHPQIIEFEFTPQDVRELSFRIRQRHINNLGAAKQFFFASYEETKQGPPVSLWVDWVEWEGPFASEDWPPLERNFITREPGTTLEEYHRTALIDFATSAFRTRQPSEAFIEKLMTNYREEVASGANATVAFREQLAVVLSSPEFLYLSEPTHGSDEKELSDRELAVRLSYFLWSGPPDAELWQAADEGRLKQPAVLREQTERLLDDPRAFEFVSGFAHQWLHMERLDFFQFNAEKYPVYDDSLKESARREVYETILDALREGRPARELLKSDHVVVNNLLAGFYGIDGVQGEHFRRVKVPPELPRGGFTGMTAILAMGSDGEKTSPVERGAWILRSLLNDPPPPAPPNVPQLNRLDGQVLSAREMTKAHQEQSQCAQCHRKIDPLGFGLENLDAIGAWRDVEVVKLPDPELTPQEKREDPKWRDKLPQPHSFPVDASGTLPDGTKFDDFFEMRDRIAEREEAFARGFLEKLIAYALGRPFSFADRKMADQIMERSSEKGYALNEIVHGIVQSKAFRMK